MGAAGKWSVGYANDLPRVVDAIRYTGHSAQGAKVGIPAARATELGGVATDVRSIGVTDDGAIDIYASSVASGATGEGAEVDVGTSFAKLGGMVKAIGRGGLADDDPGVVDTGGDTCGILVENIERAQVDVVTTSATEDNRTTDVTRFFCEPDDDVEVVNVVGNAVISTQGAKVDVAGPVVPKKIGPRITGSAQCRITGKPAVIIDNNRTNGTIETYRCAQIRNGVNLGVEIGGGG